ncbi:SMC-Scp complex subunit ScpB [Thiocapsa imhoffii]|uniref:SMC-Scp complex subunit ScpB n=1 Tax=Thiocapsa imhoffii TaxID=382777 RepID=A0A9X0WHQ9_9GAMM|nr:SMC-Scp complex subunit ScpB [Thiocapsa imhoffii]MBK1644937.1 SMC-Scp complex subunit ScpB [Thiocapsa imhoffii]
MPEPGLKQIVEAALVAAGGPLTLERLRAMFQEQECPTPEDLQAVIVALQSDYAERGLEIVEVASGWRVQVSAAVAPWVARLWEERPPRYSRALLETLSLIAYRQPITRGEIEAIRGVAVSTQIVKTLSEREWIRIVGYREVPGRPALYATTRHFLDYFGLRSLNDLPTLSELRDPDVRLDDESVLAWSGLEQEVAGEQQRVARSEDPKTEGSATPATNSVPPGALDAATEATRLEHSTHKQGAPDPDS